MLMFMVRGIFTDLEFPYAHFPTRDASADTLFPIVWDAVAQLEQAGLKVVAFACDGASADRFIGCVGVSIQNTEYIQ